MERKTLAIAHGGTGRAALARVLLAVLLVALGVLLGATAQPRPAGAMDGEEAQFLALVNQYRAAHGLGALATNGTLEQSARWMSQDMAAKDYFSHTDSLGRDPISRVAAFGYTYNTWKGENLAAGVSAAQDAFNYWKDSPGHNANMLNPNFAVIGIARVYGEGTTFGWYWSTDFGGQAEPLAEAAPVYQPAALAPVPAPEPAPPAPAPEPAPQPAPVPVATPLPSPAAAVPTGLPETAGPSPGAVSPPGWWRIELQVKPWWERLTVVGGAGPILDTVACLAGAYLEAHPGSPPRAPSGASLSARLWPAALS